MKRLNLDAFKAQVSKKQIQELENLTGGILGACHCAHPDHRGGDGDVQPIKHTCMC